MRAAPPILAAALLCAVAAPARAVPPAVPAQIHYQGVLLDDLGAPRTGLVDLTVRIYDALSSGTLLYKQEFLSAPLADGTFSLEIGPTGSASDLPTDPLTTDLATVFNGDLVAGPDRFLELSVDLDPALVRVQILTAPFALRAESAAQADSADVADVALEVTLVNGAPPQVVSEIWEHVNFDGGPPNQDPSEGLGDTDGDTILNFLDPDNDNDGLDDSSEVSQGSDINLVTPTLASVSPLNALFAVPSQVTVSGTNFEAGMSVTFGSQNPTPVNLTSTSFDLTVGPQSIGLVNVQVTRTNGETAAGNLFSFIDYGPIQNIAHGVPGPRHSTFDARPLQFTLIGQQPVSFRADTTGNSVPNVTAIVNVAGTPDYGFDPTGQIAGIGCHRTVTETCDVRVLRDTNGNSITDADDPAEYTAVESYSGTVSASISSASVGFDPANEVVAAYVRQVVNGGSLHDVVVAHDRDANQDYSGTNEVVAIETGLAGASVDLATDSVGNPAVLIHRNPGASGELRLAHDRSGDGDFDDTVGGNPEQQTLVAADVDCFGATFDGLDRLAVLYQEQGAANPTLLHDLDADGDFADPGESTSLSATGVGACGIATFFAGGLAIAHDGGSNVTLLVDYNADGDFDDPSEVRTLVVVFTSNLAVAGTPTGVFVLTDAAVFRQILP